MVQCSWILAFQASEPAHLPWPVPRVHTLTSVRSFLLLRFLCPKCLPSILHSLSPTCLLPGIFLAQVDSGLPQRVMSQSLLPQGRPHS